MGIVQLLTIMAVGIILSYNPGILAGNTVVVLPLIEAIVRVYNPTVIVSF